MASKYSLKERKVDYLNVDPRLNKFRTVKKRTKTSPTSRKLIICFAVISIILGGILLVRHHNEQKLAYEIAVKEALNIDTFYNGIIIEGVDVSGKSKDEAYKLLVPVEETLKDNINIVVKCAGQSFTLTQNDLNFSFNTEEVIDEAYNVAREGSNDERYRTVLKLEDKAQNFFIDHSLILDDDAVENFVNEIADAVYIEMKSPYISEFNPNSENMFVSHEGKTGRELDSEELTQTLNSMLKKKNYTGTIEASTHEIAITGSIDDLKSQTVLISEYSTVSTNNENANKNMALSLNAINGTVVEPGERFSFNETTGDTTTSANGYLPAGAISNGKLVEEYGGGICQSATTVYGAALRADMEITERYNHRWPSTYVPIGQDATVDYPSVDLEFENTSDYPIFIKSFMSGTTLTVQMYGYQPLEWDRIEVESQTTRTISPPAAERIADNSLASGEEVVERNAFNGYEADGSKIFYKDNQVVKTEAIWHSYYAEGAAVIRYGP